MPSERDYCPREFESLFDDDKEEVEMEMSCRFFGLRYVCPVWPSNRQLQICKATSSSIMVARRGAFAAVVTNETLNRSHSRQFVATSVYQATLPRHLAFQLFHEHTNKHTNKREGDSLLKWLKVLVHES